MLLNVIQTFFIQFLVNNDQLHRRTIRSLQQKVMAKNKHEILLLKKTKILSDVLVTPTSPPSLLPLLNSSPGTDNSFYSPANHSMQPFRKNFQCRMCRLTYKVNSFSSKFLIRSFYLFRIFMIVQLTFVKNTKSAMLKLVVSLRNWIPTRHCLHLQQEIINFV